MYSSLCHLLQILNENTKLQIGIVFLGVPRHEALVLPLKYTIHTAPYCREMKSRSDNGQNCIECRNKAIRKAQKDMKPFFGMCRGGIWEYMHPIIIDEKAVGVIFIGNILRENSRRQILQQLKDSGCENESESLLKTMAYEVSEKICRQYAELIDSYFRLLYRAVPVKEHHEQNTLMIDIQNFIDENYTSDINFETLTQMFHYNKKYLGRYFKKAMGCTLDQYICKKRIERAKQLLNDTDHHISEIATSTGFDTISYFNKCFRELTGMTPKEYRLKKGKSDA